jgi:predicted  nucleic acid-binding Zn ribbon protein
MHKISIVCLPEIENRQDGRDIRNELFHGIEELLSYYYQNGQIAQGYCPYFSDFDRDTTGAGEIACTVMTPAPDALNDRYSNRYTRQGIAKLEQLCASKLAIEYLGAVEDPAYCNCPQSASYILMAYYRSVSPIACGSCGCIKPLYLLPKVHDDGYWTIRGWEKIYQACMILDIQCGTGERWAIGQQCHHDSALSRQGRDLCRQIAELSGIPTYYFLPNYRKISAHRDRARLCPQCGGDWLLTQRELPRLDFRCDRCGLVSDLSSYHGSSLPAK